jgi:hypothetical protein
MFTSMIAQDARVVHEHVEVAEGAEGGLIA